MRYHAKERLKKSGGSEWLFEERSTPLAPTNMLLVRVIIGKVENNERLVSVLRTTPIRQGDPSWNCVGWVKEALDRLKVDGKALGSCDRMGPNARWRHDILSAEKGSASLRRREEL